MTDPVGVCLLPASGEWVYDPLPHRAAQAGASAPTVTNCNAAPGGTRTDYALSLDRLQAQHPGCTTVALVVAWFGDSVDATACRIYPTTTYPGGSAQVLSGGAWSDEPWCCSGLSMTTPGLVPLSTVGGNAVYGGTPSDPSVVRCLRDLRARGLRTVFYPFVLMDAPGYPWRGRITYPGADVSAAATNAATRMLGSAAASQFTPDPVNLTVSYAGAADDYTLRRMVLHYAALCALAGGVDLFLLGSELRGLETLRGPGWTAAGTLAADGTALWDYPFVAGLAQLAADVRGVFDAAGLARDAAVQRNLVSYSADWSVWMGVQHEGAAGQWPHLDALYASAAVDLVCFDNYLPLSDWTSGDGGLDAANWSAPEPSGWPPPVATMNNLGLTGAPALASAAYLKANIEGGEGFAWFYNDGTNGGRGADPAGSLLQVSVPQGDRLVQARSPYAANQQILAPKQIRWWWANTHQAIYDAGDGQGWQPHGPATAWVPQSKSIAFVEYGFPSCDRATNQPNVFFDPKSSESCTPYWSAWDPVAGAGYTPRRDDALADLARQALVQYWTSDGNNVASPAGLPMVEPAFCCAWNWDARPFPAFPILGLWGDAPNWPTGTWIDGKDPFVPPPAPDPPPAAPVLSAFPAVTGQGWSTVWRPTFSTGLAQHGSGREVRAARESAGGWEVEIRFDKLSPGDLATLAGFYEAQEGGATPFLMPAPPELGQGAGLAMRFAEDGLEVEAFAAGLASVKVLKLLSVK